MFDYSKCYLKSWYAIKKKNNNCRNIFKQVFHYSFCSIYWFHFMQIIQKKFWFFFNKHMLTYFQIFLKMFYHQFLKLLSMIYSLFFQLCFQMFFLPFFSFSTFISLVIAEVLTNCMLLICKTVSYWIQLFLTHNK